MILLTGDWHLHNFPQFSRMWRPGLNTRARDIFEVVSRRIPRVIEKHKTRVFCYLGDFNFRASNEYRLVNLTLEALLSCVHPSELVMCCAGNHDTDGTSKRDHNGIPYLYSGHWTPFYYQSMDTLFWPVGYNDPLPTVDELKGACVNRIHNVVVMLHKNVEGGRASNGFIYSQSKGFVSYRQLLELKKQFPPIIYFNGHYHDYQIIKKLVCVVGAPVQHRRSDENMKRGVVLFNEETRKIQFVELDGPRFVSVTVPELANYTTAPETTYITIKVKNEVEKRQAYEWKRDTKRTASVKEEFEEQNLPKGKLVGLDEDTVEVPDAELLDKWLKITEPALSAKQRAELVRVGESL